MSNDGGFDDVPPNDSPFGEDNEASMYKSAIAPGTVDISLNESDDEDPFGSGPSKQTIPTNTVQSSTANQDKLFQPDTSPAKVDDNDDEDVFQTKKPTNTTSSGYSSSKQEGSSYSADLNTSSAGAAATFDSNQSSTTTKPVQRRSNEYNIEITVSDPTKVGEGMSSFMTYRITTKTNMPTFSSQEFSVNRRFSDFLGLHTKVVQKYVPTGVFVPSPPEKDLLSTTKVKISKDDSISLDFLDRRRSLLERYLNRLAQNSKFLEDADVKDFLENPNELPKSKDTQALSGAGVLRALTNISNSVAKLTSKANEQDQWFEEKYKQINDLQTHLKQLYNQFDALFIQRKEAGHVLKQFSVTLNHLATIEEHTLLSSALMELANVQEKVEQTNNDHLLKEYTILTELMKEYLLLIDMVNLAFNERIKLHQIWLSAEETLKKKRENKTKLEQNPKNADKIPQAEAEISEWEGKVEKGKQDFESATATIKDEMEVFEQTRITDFKNSVENYLKNLIEQQEKILQLWENYLPEANKIAF